MNSLPNNVAFYQNVPCYFMKDDHDTWMNDCHAATKTKFMGEFTFKQGAALFKQQVPHSEKSYRTFRWGKDVQIWLFDGRDYRKPNEMPDGPDKTIWGKEQMAWFKETYKSSDATFKILISPTPIIGPDRPQKRITTQTPILYLRVMKFAGLFKVIKIHLLFVAIGIGNTFQST